MKINILKNTLFALMLAVITAGCSNAVENTNGNEEPTISPKDCGEDEYPYYFYGNGGEKVYLTLHTKYAFLSVKEPQLPADIIQRGIKAEELISDDVDKRYPDAQCRYITELTIEHNLSDKEYLELLSDIKRKNKDIIIGPYFKDQYGNKLGACNFFYVKLKEKNDVALLEQMAEHTGSIIIGQNEFMPLWFSLSITEASELNGMSCANFFHESGLFEAGEPDFVSWGESVFNNVK